MAYEYQYTVGADQQGRSPLAAPGHRAARARLGPGERLAAGRERAGRWGRQMSQTRSRFRKILSTA